MHCLREEVAGEWTFDLGADNEKGDVNCRDFAAQTQMKVARTGQFQLHGALFYFCYDFFDPCATPRWKTSGRF